MQRTDSLEKTLTLGKIEGRGRRGWQRMRSLDGITNSVTWIWAKSRRWWRTGKPGVLQFTGQQRVGHNWVTELNWCLLWRNVCLGLFPTVWLGLFFWYWVVWAACIFWKLILCRLLHLLLFSPILKSCIFTLLIVSFDVQKLLRLIRSHLFIFAFISNILGGGSWRRQWKLTPVFLPGESQAWRSLVGCRMWGSTESDTTDET